MIVYNVQGRRFAEKVAAETYRKAESLKPAATLKVNGRDDLLALLDAPCEPAAKGQPIAAPATLGLVDRAFVAPTVRHRR